MKLILKENIKDLGNTGDVIQVSDGYARNYLIPKGLAKLATPQNIKLLDQESKERKNKLMKEKKEAELFAKSLEEISCTIVKKAGEKDKLFGSVTPQDIQEGLKNEGIEIDKKKIVLEEPIKTLGVYKASIQVHPEVTASLNPILYGMQGFTQVFSAGLILNILIFISLKSAIFFGRNFRSLASSTIIISASLWDGYC